MLKQNNEPKMPGRIWLQIQWNVGLRNAKIVWGIIARDLEPFIINFVHVVIPEFIKQFCVI